MISREKIWAVIQVVIIVAIVGYGTYNLYRGNFELSMSTIPFLMAYYIFITVRQRRLQARENEGEDE